MTSVSHAFHLKNPVVYVALLLTMVGLIPFTAEAQAPTVPPSFQTLYTQEQNYLDNFNATLSSSGNGTTFPTLYTGTLKQADSNSGAQLVSTGYITGVQTQLQALKALGVKAVMVEIGFPMLYEPFLTSQGQTQAAFVTFYQQVAAMVRAQGMKLIVENNNMLSNDVQAGWDTAPFYETLDWNTYQQARAQTAATIAQTVQPDYMVVLEEPDTEAMNSGQTNVNTSDGANAMLSQILASLQPYRQNGLKVGAGLGSWLYGFQNFIQGFVAQPMDFIDMHIYPINLNFLPNALTIANMAASAGMPVAMTECWLNKELDSEVNVLSVDQIRARSPFSFWEPLDAYFLQTMRALANNTQMLFLAPTNSEYFYVYQDYNDTTANMSSAAIIAQEQSLMSQANAQGTFSPTGMSYYTANVSPADTTAPSTPLGLTGVSGNPTTAYLTWNVSSDDIGVAGYHIRRDGNVVATTAQLLPTTPPPSNTIFFTDTGLTEATTYTYTVEALDLGGNVSNSSTSIPVTTADVTPPTAPGTLTAKAVSCNKVTLTWTASQDNATIAQYLISWGLSPGSLIQIGSTYGTKTSYSYSNLSPATTYYFAVQAQDSYHNQSVMSSVVAVTTPALPAPPSTITATPNATTRATITWSASTGGMAIANYHVYRGTAPNSLSQIATTTKTTYTDTTLTIATTYYYAIQAVDTGVPPDLSAISAPVAVTTFSPPAAPTNLVATAQATTRIGLTWSPAVSGGLPIANYRVWRGSSPGNLVQLAITTKTSYTDTTVTQGTQYYYAVQAADTGSDLSTLSPAVPVTTFGAPSQPATVTANPTSASKMALAWSASVPNGLAIASYHVYRGTTPSNLTQIVVTTKTTYTDSSLNPATTYYYSIDAVDTGGDHSGMTPPITGTTYALPTTPGNVVAQGTSSTLMTVTWSASTGSLAIGHYNVLRGTSPNNLSQIAQSTKTTYSDRTVTSGTTYYYSIQAADSAGDLSVASTPVAGTTP